MYGHIGKLAAAEKKGIEAAGGTATVLQVAETLPEEVLAKMGAAGLKDESVPVLSDPKQLRKTCGAATHVVFG
jgi:NAD(P)H dehydrogenase (quinone)